MAYLDNVTNILQIQPDGLPTVVRLSQNENGRNLYFRLVGNEDAIPSGVTVTISGTKPDGVVYSKTGSITNDVVLITEDTQLTAVSGTWDAKIKIVSSGQTIATGRVRFEIDADPVAPGSVPSDSQLEGLVAEAQQYAETAREEAYGSPLTASTVAGMTDHSRVYVYTGSETGYTAGNWYYWNGSAWTSGGVYNSVAVQTDKTLSVADKAADGKAVGDAIDEAVTDLKSDLNDITEEISGTIERKIYTPIAYDLSNNTVTRSGITFAQSTNETIAVTGTATANAMATLTDINGNTLSFSLVAGKTYRLRGCPAGGAGEVVGAEKYRLDLRTAVTGGTVVAIDCGEGAIFTVETSGVYYPFIRIASGTTVNLMFAPEMAEETIIEVTGDILTAVDYVARSNLSLLEDEIPDTVQTYTFTDGKVSQVIHSRSGAAIRTDAFTYGTETIAEVRTLSTGESLTIVTNLTTLETTITYAAA